MVRLKFQLKRKHEPGLNQLPAKKYQNSDVKLNYKNLIDMTQL